VNGPVVGWDIGGANVKAGRLDAPAAEPVVVERPFALWREPGRLVEVLAEVAARLGPARAAALTMTAELADCFASKAEGVRFVLDAAARALGDVPLHVYGLDGRFHPPEVARRQPRLAAAANWLASATWLARRWPDALLLDMGSTTTDVIPIVAGRVAAAGRSDPERLRAGELVYTGVLRTPICALVRRVPLAAGWCRVAAETFAIAADAHLWLGGIAPEAYTCETPDGRGTSRTESAARLARVVCADPQDLAEGDVSRIARHVVRAQRRQLVAALRQVLREVGGRGDAVPRTALVTGAGERAAAEAARRAGLAVVHLGVEWVEGALAALVAPATAVAALLLEQDPPGEETPAPRSAGAPPGVNTVVKLGGSLERAGLLQPILPVLAGLAGQGHRLLVVPGGGRFADAVRELCAANDPGPDTAHWWAVAAMDQLARLIVRSLPEAMLVTGPAEVRAALDTGRLPVLAPFAWLRAEDPLPHSWDVTADSIAAWVAGRVGARRLVLVKSLQPPPAPAEDLARQGVVDPFFPTLLRPQLDLAVVGGDRIDRLRQIIL